MDDLTNIDVESLTEEERRELRSKIMNRLGLEEETSQKIDRIDLVEETRKIREKSEKIRAAQAEERKKLTEQILEPYQQVEDTSDTEEIIIDETMKGYLSTLRKTKKLIDEDADLMSGGTPSAPATLADLASLRTALSSLGGGGMGHNEVESLINTTVVNNFGLTPLDSSAASTFDSDDVVTIVDSDYIEQRLPEDVKVRFRLDATTPVVLNSSGVTSVTATSSGQRLTFDINFDTPFASADDYITMLTLDQEGVDRTSTVIPIVNAESRTPVVIQQNTGSVEVAVEKVDTADNQDEGVLNVKIFKF